MAFLLVLPSSQRHTPPAYKHDLAAVNVAGPTVRSSSVSDHDTLARRMTQPMSRGRMLAGAAGITGGLVAGSRLTTAFASGTADNGSGDTPQQIFTAALIAEGSCHDLL